MLKVFTQIEEDQIEMVDLRLSIQLTHWGTMDG